MKDWLDVGDLWRTAGRTDAEVGGVSMDGDRALSGLPRVSLSPGELCRAGPREVMAGGPCGHRDGFLVSKMGLRVTYGESSPRTQGGLEGRAWVMTLSLSPLGLSFLPGT